MEGAELPQPFAERRFWDKLNLRLGSDLHRRVALAAAEAGLSINSYLHMPKTQRRPRLEEPAFEDLFGHVSMST